VPRACAREPLRRRAIFEEGDWSTAARGSRFFAGFPPPMRLRAACCYSCYLRTRRQAYALAGITDCHREAETAKAHRG